MKQRGASEVVKFFQAVVMKVDENAWNPTEDGWNLIQFPLKSL